MSKNQKGAAEKIKVQTPEFRVSFPALFEAKSVKPGDKAKFSVQMLFRVKPNPKKPEEKVVDLKPLKDAVRAVIEEKFGTDRTKWPAGLMLPFRDGNEAGKKEMDGYGDGVIFCTASSINKPGVVYAHAGTDNRPAPMTVPSDLYGGCYARATINPYYWTYMGKQGVSLGLQNVQKLRDGDAFGGRGNAAMDFDAIDVPAGAVPAGAAAGASSDPLGL